ncbi:hypothetical protein H2200_006680 [Cladophialophora chaetospira]|uniref:Uncharacterized protein n=1 Tax=Cladophialophora chaetospira TaxID=386627 RepID=A0AA39CI36_9EURO|nr:hypothetical protein H2200_006680 [Cladophialophora chaetospira]
MSTRGDDRPYKVVYSNRRREEIEDQIPSRRARRDAEYEDDYRAERVYSRDQRDDRMEVDRWSRNSDLRTSEAAALTKTRYAVGRDRNAESYVKRTDAIVIDERPSDRGRYDYEVVRPQKRDDGTYVIDLGGGSSHGYVVDLDSRGYDRPQRPRYDAPPPSRRDDLILYETSRGGGRDRVRDIPYKDVQVMEDFEDDRYSRRGRASEVYAEDVPPPPRLKSAIRGRNGSRPDLQRRASVGFLRDQISHHDASESRHERPGAEAHLAGRYLEGNGQFDDDTYASGYTRRNRSRSRSQNRYGPQRSDPRLREYDEIDEDRRTFTEETMRRYEYEDGQRPAYAPQRGHSRRRRRHHRDDEDDRYSTYDTEYVKKTTKEYSR